MICVSLVLIRNVDKCMAWILPLLSDKDANMKVQIFVLRKNTADILDALGLENVTSSQIKKLSGDNTRDEKERVMDALSAGLVGPM